MYNFGFRVEDLRFRFRIQGLGFRAQGSGFRVSVSVYGSVRISGIRSPKP